MTSQIHEAHPMKTDKLLEPAPLFAQMVSAALGRWKNQLRCYYLRSYPDSGEIIDHIINEEEAKAWEITALPVVRVTRRASYRLRRSGIYPSRTLSAA